MNLAVRVIPCLDVDNGRVVKGVNFTGLRDAGRSSRDWRTLYDREGADELTFLDITASSQPAGRPPTKWSGGPPSRSSSR